MFLSPRENLYISLLTGMFVTGILKIYSTYQSVKILLYYRFKYMNQ